MRNKEEQCWTAVQIWNIIFLGAQQNSINLENNLTASSRIPLGFHFGQRLLLILPLVSQIAWITSYQVRHWTPACLGILHSHSLDETPRCTVGIFQRCWSHDCSAMLRTQIALPSFFSWFSKQIGGPPSTTHQKQRQGLTKECPCYHFCYKTNPQTPAALLCETHVAKGTQFTELCTKPSRWWGLYDRFPKFLPYGSRADLPHPPTGTI